jgi:hypothetical protein
MVNILCVLRGKAESFPFTQKILDLNTSRAKDA